MTDYTIYHSLNKVDEGPSMGLDTFEERRADSDQRFIKNYPVRRAPLPETYQTMFQERYLSQRARLEFHYPFAGENGDDIIAFMPFYENPEITESQAANYAEYNPIGRSSSMFAYTGAKSRKFKVKITFTLPHLSMHDMGIDRFMRIYSGDSKRDKKSLFVGDSSERGGVDVPLSLATEVSKVYWELYNRPEKNRNLALSEELLDNPPKAYPSERAIMNAPNTLGVFNPSVFQQQMQAQFDLDQRIRRNKLVADAVLDDNIELAPGERDKIIDTMLFFIALLRTSVVNNSEETTKGPPLLRLNFGTLYQSVPCICKNYNLKWEEKAGYHVESLTPRQLVVDLTLNEVRIGNFGKYMQANFANRDNLAGWESVIDHPFTTNPMNLTAVAYNASNRSSS